MILVAGHAVFSLENLEAVRADIREIETTTRAEDGCLYYAMAFNTPDSGEVTILEQWRDSAALDAHLRTQTLKDFQERNAPRALFFEVKRYDDIGEGRDAGAIDD